MNLTELYKKHKSARQASMLFVSTIVGVIIGMGVSVLNTRYLIPSEYGDVRYINNFISFFSGILLLGYFVSGSRLLALAATKEEASRLKGGTIFILGCTVIVLIFVLVLTGLVHHYILHKPFYWLFYAVIPVCFNALLLNYINTTSQGSNDIGTISAARIFPSFIYLLIAWCVYFYWGATPLRMLWLSNGIAIIVLLLLLWNSKPSFDGLRNSLSLLKDENRHYGFHVYLGSLANISIPYIAGVTLGIFAVDNANVAFYTLALTISRPLSMAPSAIGTTYFKQFAIQNKISSKVIKSTVFISIISLILYCIVIFPLVRVLYDSSYQVVAWFGCWLAIASVCQGLGDVFNRFLGAHGEGKYLRNGAWISGIISLIGYTIGVYLFEINGAIVTCILSSMAYMVCMIVYYRIFVYSNNAVVQ